VVLNGTGKIMQIAKLEMQFAGIKRALDVHPFALPGQK